VIGKFGQFKTMVFCSLFVATAAFAEQQTVTVYELTTDSAKQGIGKKLGTVVFQDSEKGLLIQPKIKGLKPGKHGFHIHMNPACEGEMQNDAWVPGAKGGPHLDPHETKKHLGPNQDGHLGDLPVLVVNNAGRADKVLIAPRLKLKDILNRSFMIHEGGDNYSDEPPLGGGGARIACGVIK
jgi:Cu-Zn family superoxide dismutase